MRAAALFALIVSCVAFARDAEDRLHTIIVPNEGRPAIVRPGDTISVLTRSDHALSLIDGDRRIELQATWKAAPGGLREGRCVVPNETASGIFSISASDGAAEDINLRSVFVNAAPPETYGLAHVAGIGGVADLAALATALNSSGAAMAVVSGPLTATGAAAEFRALLGFLRSLAMPALVTPGESDAMFADYFGPGVYTTRFGRDAYMGIGPLSNADLGPLYRQRRGVRDARWSVALSSEDPAQWPMRAQLMLFTDDPLDFVLSTGEDARSEVPWGTAFRLSTPAGAWRLMRVEEFEPAAGEVQVIGASE